jgi:hypothetical protein
VHYSMEVTAYNSTKRFHALQHSLNLVRIVHTFDHNHIVTYQQLSYYPIASKHDDSYAISISVVIDSNCPIEICICFL